MACFSFGTSARGTLEPLSTRQWWWGRKSLRTLRSPLGSLGSKVRVRGAADAVCRNPDSCRRGSGAPDGLLIEEQHLADDRLHGLLAKRLGNQERGLGPLAGDEL